MSRLWYNEEVQKISGNKRKMRSINTSVDLYEVCLSYIIYFLLLYFMAVFTPFCFFRSFGISFNRGKEFRKYCPKGFELEEDKYTGE